MAANILRYLEATLTQGGADTFVQAALTTDILPENGLAFQVKAIEFLFTGNLSGISADAYVRWSLSRDTKTGWCAYSDPDSMLADGYNNSLTTSGQVIIPCRHYYDALPGIYIVEPTIYAQLASASTGLTLVADLRVYYEEIKLTEIEILRILNNA